MANCVLADRLKRKELLVTKAFIDGEWIESETQIDVVNPATGKPLGRVSMLDPVWVDKSVEAASKAFEKWRERMPVERGNILRRWAELLRQNCADLSIIITSEQGKPLADSRDEVSYAAGFLDWFAAEGERTYGETIPSHKSGSELSVRYQPIGVTACVTPWNFPMAMITRKAGAALAAGCSMIAKPASETPFSALALAYLGKEAGIPSGVFQVLPGDARLLTECLLDHEEVRAFSFTGSTEVGRLLLRQAANTIKCVSMELGGHAPFIVCSGAKLDEAVKGCMTAKFATSGQDCLAANRIYVHQSLLSDFEDKLARNIRALKVGNGLDQDISIGPMTKISIVEKCHAHIKDALAKGAKLLAGGETSPFGEMFVTPTLLSDVTKEMLIAKEETFGPVAAILPFDDEDEMLRDANDTEMGLAAYVYCNDLAQASYLADRLEFGMVAINTASFTGPPIPFGGWKQSGLGREGSRHGILEFMELKYVCLGGLRK